MKKFLIAVLIAISSFAVFIIFQKISLSQQMKESAAVFFENPSRHVFKSNIMFSKGVVELIKYTNDKDELHKIKAKQYFDASKGFLEQERYVKFKELHKAVLDSHNKILVLLEKDFTSLQVSQIADEYQRNLVALEFTSWSEVSEAYNLFVAEDDKFQNMAILFFMVLALAILFYFRLNQKHHESLKIHNKELQRVQHQLKITNADLEASLHLFDYGDFIMFKLVNDEQKSVEYVSTNVKTILGYDKLDFINKKVDYLDLIYHEDKEQFFRENKQAVEAKLVSFVSTPYRFKTKKGEYRWLYNSNKLVYDDDGKLKNVIGYISDITQFKNQEKIIQEQTKMASMGEMIANIAHQWRQPLSVISTNASGIGLKIDFGVTDVAVLKEDAMKIVQTSQYLSSIIDDFRNFLKSDKQKEFFKLTETINSSLNILQGMLKTYDITIIDNFSHTDVDIYGVANELTQVMINIISNSKDAFKEQVSLNDKIIVVSVNMFNNEKVQISLKDSANGIKEDVLPKIFEPYFTTKHKSIGTGLGLYMSHSIITQSFSGQLEARNICFDVDENIYCGAEFLITLPIKI